MSIFDRTFIDPPFWCARCNRPIVPLDVVENCRMAEWTALFECHGVRALIKIGMHSRLPTPSHPLVVFQAAPPVPPYVETLATRAPYFMRKRRVASP